jgi:hypothetical protein
MGAERVPEDDPQRVMSDPPCGQRAKSIKLNLVGAWLSFRLRGHSSTTVEALLSPTRAAVLRFTEGS